MNENKSKTSQPKDAPGTDNLRIVYRSFTHLDGFKEFIDYQKMEMIQLSPGPLQGEFLSIQIGNLYFAYNQVNQGLQTSGGGTPEYMSFVMIWSEKEKEYYSLNTPIEPQRTLFGFNNTESYEVFH
ncbi:hypothetical protein, partial [Okeania sp. SIO2B9]